MFGFFFGLILGASVGGNSVSVPPMSDLLYVAKGLEGREIDPLKVKTCVTSNGDWKEVLGDPYSSCKIKDVNKWEIIRVVRNSDGYLYWVLYPKD